MLFTGQLPAKARKYLGDSSDSPPSTGPGLLESSAESAVVVAEKEPAADHTATEPRRNAARVEMYHRDGALALLSLFQREGRLVDFLREPLDGYADADIGAAVRDVHRGCKKVVEDCVHWDALMPGEEDEPVTVEPGFDPTEIRLVGDVRGEPPFQGVLRHRGLRATKVTFPTLTEGIDRTVVAPAEVEVS